MCRWPGVLAEPWRQYKTCAMTTHERLQIHDSLEEQHNSVLSNAPSLTFKSSDARKFLAFALALGETKIMLQAKDCCRKLYIRSNLEKKIFWQLAIPQKHSLDLACVLYIEAPKMLKNVLINNSVVETPIATKKVGAKRTSLGRLTENSSSDCSANEDSRSSPSVGGVYASHNSNHRQTAPEPQGVTMSLWLKPAGS